MKLNLKIENVRSHGSIDFYFKIVFRQTFRFQERSLW